jgi:hypothetical protein
MTADPSPGHFIGLPSLNVGYLRQFAWFLSRGKTDTPKVGVQCTLPPRQGLPVTVCHAWRDPAGEGSLEMIPIVALGASAGGLEAICELLAALPPESSLAYVLVQHLDPAHESLLPEILATKTAMAVRQIRDGMSVVASHVYVIPPNATLTLLEGCLRLMPRRTGAVPNLPIDTFFASVAEEQSTAAVAVILSGYVDFVLTPGEIATAGSASRTSNVGSLFHGPRELPLPPDILKYMLVKSGMPGNLPSGKSG